MGQSDNAGLGPGMSRTTAFSAAMTILVGVLGLGGWITGLRFLASVRSEYIPISPDTALFFLVLGLILLVGRFYSGVNTTVVRAVLGLVSLYGLLKFIEYFVDVDLTFESFIFPATETVGTFLVKRMSPLTGFLFFTSGIALHIHLFSRHRRLSTHLVSSLGAIALAVGFVATLGYVFGTPLLYGGDFIPLAAPTAVGFLFLGCGFLAAAGPESVLVRFIAGDAASARLLRTILPIIVLAMIIESFAEVTIPHAFGINSVVVTAIATVIFIVLTGIMVARSSQTIFRRADEAERERKRAVEELRSALEHRGNIINSSLDMIIAVDVSRLVTEFNTAAQEIFGYQKDEVVGHHIDMLYANPEEGERVHRITTERGHLVQEILNRRKNGEVFPSMLSASVLRDGGGNIIGVMGVSRDITERRQAAQTIADALNFNTTMLEASPVGIIAYKSTGEVISLNQASASIVGATKEQLKSQNWRTIDSWKRHGLYDAARSALEGNLEVGLDTFMVTTFGKEKWLSCRFVPFRVGGEQHLLLVFADITEQKKAEELNRDLFQAIERTEEIIFMTDREGLFTYVNPAFERVYGHKETEIIGKMTPRILKSDLQGKEFYEDFWKTLLAGNNYRGEILNQTKSGRVVSIDTSVAPIVDERQTLAGFLAVQKDISEQKKAEDALRKAEERYRTLFEQSPDGIIVIDPETLLPIQFNEKIHKQLGYTREEFARLRVSDYEVVETRELTMQRAEKIMREGRDNFESKHRTKNGEIRDVHVNVLRITLNDKPVFYTIFRDITDQKKLEQQLLRNQRIESIGTLAGGIAHDLNNVLGPILLSLEVLRSKIQDQRLHRMLETMESSAQRGADLIKQVLSFARGLEGERVTIQLRHLVNEVGQVVKETFPRSITLESKIPRDLWTVVGDSTQIHQVLMNLCVNARDAMPAGGRIEITGENVTLDQQYTRMHLEAKPGNYLVLTVSDTGMGIPPEVKERIFEPFFTTKEVGKGTGLGLSTVLAIVKGHGGFINVYSETRKGTTFKVYLPAKEMEEARKTKLPEVETGKGELILVVDDEEAVREITRTTLEAFGYNVVTATDGAEAMARFVEKKAEISLVITDMVMPHMDGVATIRALKRIEPGLKILLVSGLTQNAESIHDEKGVAFLAKPYTSHALLHLIRSVLDSK